MRAILIFILSFSAMAAYIKKDKVGECENVYVYSTAKKCGSDCIEIKRGYDCNYYKMDNELVNDFDRPQWGTRSMVEPCSGESDCKSKALAKECTDGRGSYYNAEYSEVWCNKIIGYDKKLSGRKIVIEDETKKTSYQTQEATKKADKAAMAIASQALDCGKKVISRMLLQNKPKDLSKAQVRNLVKTYKDIKNLLDTGSLESAREDILAVAINEPIVTQADKDALVAELDKCKP